MVMETYLLLPPEYRKFQDKNSDAIHFLNHLTIRQLSNIQILDHTSVSISLLLRTSE